VPKLGRGEKDWAADSPQIPAIQPVPIVAPLLHDVILKNVADKDKPEVWVTVMAQEI
jgi:hypothetical protein